MKLLLHTTIAAVILVGLFHKPSNPEGKPPEPSIELQQGSTPKKVKELRAMKLEALKKEVVESKQVIARLAEQGPLGLAIIIGLLAYCGFVFFYLFGLIMTKQKIFPLPEGGGNSEYSGSSGCD